MQSLPSTLTVTPVALTEGTVIVAQDSLVTTSLASDRSESPDFTYQISTFSIWLEPLTDQVTVWLVDSATHTFALLCGGVGVMAAPCMTG